MLTGIAIFLLGSVLAGFAWSMPAMIAFRLIQGIGAGAIQPVTLTIVADLYPARERGKVQGYLASVWAISAVVGPMVGGTDHPQPVVGVDLLDERADRPRLGGGLHRVSARNATARATSIDFVGAVLFTVAIAALMMCADVCGDDEWHGRRSRAACSSCAAAVRVQERRAAEPMISFRALEPPADRRRERRDGARPA